MIYLRPLCQILLQIRKQPPTKLKCFADLFAAANNIAIKVPSTEQIDIIYDSYLEDSIKECERIRRRSTCEPLEFVNLTTSSPIPVQMDRFCACGKIKKIYSYFPDNISKEFARKNI